MPTAECHTQAHLVFPDECIQCGRSPSSIATLEAGRRWDLLFLSHETSVDVTVPVCLRCRWLRTVGGWGFGTLVLVMAFALMFAIIDGVIGVGLERTLRVAMGMGLVFATILYMRNWHARWMDRLLLGVSAGRLCEDGTFQLYVRREGVSERLGYASEPKHYVTSLSYATEEERGQQQLDSWWGKTLVGLVMLACAYWVWRDLTDLEGGAKRWISLPGIVMLMYDFTGKWPPVLLFAMPGTCVFLWGLRQKMETM